MGAETVARRYAGALADVVIANKEADAVRTELRGFERMLMTNHDLYSAFSNPSITHKDKELVLHKLLERTSPLGLTGNFLKVLLKNSRLTDLASINERFDAELDKRRNITSASVTSARELTEAEKNDLKANLQALTGKDVNLEFSIDEDLIGGAVTRMASVVYDGSVKTQLELLRQQMIDS